MRKSLILLAIALLTGLIAAWWFLFWHSTSAVETAMVETGPAVELVYATGFVEAEQPVTVSSRVTAPVEEILAHEGDRVVIGQPLARLDDTEQRALLAQAQAEAQGKTQAERRIVSLYDKGWVTRAARDEAVAAGRAARAAVSALEARLDQMTIRAGISGVVLKRDIEQGDLARPGTLLFQLGDPAMSRVTATVDERDIPRVAVGQAALLSTDALAGRVIHGHVTEITPGGNPDERAFRVRIGLDDAKALPFGLTLEVNIVIQRHENALLVPAGAVGEGHVWVADTDDRVEHRAVTVGIVGMEKVEIMSGLTEGERVVTNPPDGLEDGDRVRP